MRDTLEILFLIVIANAAPVITSLLLAHRASLPVDFNYRLKDNQPVFGRTKTWRGLLTSLLFTAVAAATLNYGFLSGLIIASLAMSGDLLSSFIKRRLKIKSSSSRILLDQLPESLFPALFIQQVYSLALIQVIEIVLSFIIIELILSTALLRLHHRKKTWTNN